MTDIIESRTELSTEMTQAERDRRDELIGVVNEHLHSALKCWVAWKELRESRLYRETHPTWPAFCQDQWDLSRAYVDRKIAASDVIFNLTQDENGVFGLIDESSEENGAHGRHFPLPQNERQARPLTEFNKPEQLQIWETVVEAAGPDGKITASLVEAAAKKHRGDQVREKLSGLRKSRETQVSRQFDFGFNQFKNEIERAMMDKFRDTSKTAVLRYIDGLIEIRESIAKM